MANENSNVVLKRSDWVSLRTVVEETGLTLREIKTQIKKLSIPLFWEIPEEYDLQLMSWAQILYYVYVKGWTFFPRNDEWFNYFSIHDVKKKPIGNRNQQFCSFLSQSIKNEVRFVKLSTWNEFKSFKSIPEKIIHLKPSIGFGVVLKREYERWPQKVEIMPDFDNMSSLNNTKFSNTYFDKSCPQKSLEFDHVLDFMENESCFYLKRPFFFEAYVLSDDCYGFKKFIPKENDDDEKPTSYHVFFASDKKFDYNESGFIKDKIKINCYDVLMFNEDLESLKQLKSNTKLKIEGNEILASNDESADFKLLSQEDIKTNHSKFNSFSPQFKKLLMLLSDWEERYETWKPKETNNSIPNFLCTVFIDEKKTAQFTDGEKTAQLKKISKIITLIYTDEKDKNDEESIGLSEKMLIICSVINSCMEQLVSATRAKLAAEPNKKIKSKYENDISAAYWHYRNLTNKIHLPNRQHNTEIIKAIQKKLNAYGKVELSKNLAIEIVSFGVAIRPANQSKGK